MVSTQAHTTRRATPQRTADRRRVAPTPTMAPVMVWVVLTGMPIRVFMARAVAPAVSAAKPPTGCSLVIREPMVCTMRQPPVMVPRAMAAWAESTTHSGISGRAPFGPEARNPPATSTAVMMPIVFWASLPPCPSE